MKAILDPVVLFFILGAVAGLLKSDLRVPQSFYNTISLYLLISIGIKGGIELYHSDADSVVIPILATLLLGVIITNLAKFMLDKTNKFNAADAISIATHYGSVSAVTFAVVISYVKSQGIAYENYMTVLLVMLEIPAIITGVILAAKASNKANNNIGVIIKEVFLGKSILLIVGGILIGYTVGYTDNKQINFFFFDLFKGFLCLFMLEMGIITSERIKDLKKVGLTLIAFGVVMPLISATLGILTGVFCGLSQGGTTIPVSYTHLTLPTNREV